MTPDDWAYIKRLGASRGVTLKDAGVKRTQTLGYAIDSVLAAQIDGPGAEADES